MRQTKFEIIQRGSGCFRWLYIEQEEFGRRVLARSAIEYDSVEDAVFAIAEMQNTAIEEACDDVTWLPTTDMRIVEDVVPLRVDDASSRRWRSRQRRIDLALVASDF